MTFNFPIGHGKTARLCKIADCGKKHYALGWCDYHWRRNHVTGDPTTPTRVRVRRPVGEVAPVKPLSRFLQKKSQPIVMRLVEQSPKVLRLLDRHWERRDIRDWQSRPHRDFQNAFISERDRDYLRMNIRRVS